MAEAQEQHPKPLDGLLTEAARYAEFCLRSSGQVPPTMFAATEQGLLTYMPEGMGDVKAKDDFVTKARFICAAYGASAVVMVLESWVTKAKPGEPLDRTPPSESYEREECVVLLGEGKGTQCSRFLPIVRTDAGGFWGFGDADTPKMDSNKGRFAQVLPPKEVTPEMRAMSRAVLTVMGVKVDLLKE